MVQRCIEHDTLNLIAPLPHAHRVAEHSTRVTRRSALGVTWQLTSVSLNFHLPCPSLGVFAHMGRTRDWSDSDPPDLDLPLCSSFADGSHAKLLAVTEL